jgi:hypothetical protein
VVLAAMVTTKTMLLLGQVVVAEEQVLVV